MEIHKGDLRIGRWIYWRTRLHFCVEIIRGDLQKWKPRGPSPALFPFARLSMFQSTRVDHLPADSHAMAQDFCTSAMRSDADVTGFNWFNSNLPGMYKVSFMFPIRKLLLSSGNRHVHCGNRICDTRKGLYSEESLPQLSSPRLAMKKSAKSRNFQGMSRNSKLLATWQKRNDYMTIGYSFLICTKFNI